MKICVATYFTRGWGYSVDSWLDRVFTALRGHSGLIIISTDQSDECLAKATKIKEKFRGWEFSHVATPVETDNRKPYGTEAQLIIARIQHAAFSKAREYDCDYFWSVESDILVPPNAFSVLRQALEFDDGYYGVAMVTYPNGQFLGGRGTPDRQICEDVYDDERKIPKEFLAKLKSKKKQFSRLVAPTEAQITEMRELHEKVKSFPPSGNVFHLQSKRWRRRGWMEAAYPGIGRGAILPTDWVGLGCTMMNRKALSLATFEGYELGGTQDLFLCWNRWTPAGIRMCVIPHIVCSHVKKQPDGGFAIQDASHVLAGEHVGHLRWEQHRYYSF